MCKTRNKDNLKNARTAKGQQGITKNARKAKKLFGDDQQMMIPDDPSDDPSDDPASNLKRQKAMSNKIRRAKG